MKTWIILKTNLTDYREIFIKVSGNNRINNYTCGLTAIIFLKLGVDFMIGIIGAMDKEVKMFIEHLGEVNTRKRASMTFFSGFFHNKQIVVVKSGIGKVNAAACTQALIDFYKPRAVFCTGVAGALQEDLDIGDMVISKDVVQYDVDASAFGHEPGEIPNLGIKAIKASEKLAKITLETHQSIFKNRKAIIGRILTGDQFISSQEKARLLAEQFRGMCVEMEGAAIGHVCYLNLTPFLVIRSISDKANGEAVEDYRIFVDEVAKRSFILLSAVIKRGIPSELN
jgi:adenosylhomocysteine nucleosidase